MQNLLYFLFLHLVHFYFFSEILSLKIIMRLKNLYAAKFDRYNCTTATCTSERLTRRQFWSLLDKCLTSDFSRVLQKNKWWQYSHERPAGLRSCWFITRAAFPCAQFIFAILSRAHTHARARKNISGEILIPWFLCAFATHDRSHRFVNADWNVNAKRYRRLISGYHLRESYPLFVDRWHRYY